MHPDIAEVKFYTMFTQKDMHVIDAGAQGGNHALLFSFLCTKVHAFEPDPRCYEKLHDFFVVTPRGNVELIQKALWNEPGSVKLNMYDDKHMAWSTIAKRPLEPGGVNVEVEKVIDVPTITIDNYCEVNDINKIGLLKLDVEGAELQVLQGASGLLENGAVQCCVMEYGRTWWDMGYTPDEIEELLTGYEFEIMNVLHDGPIFPGRESGYDSKYAIMVAAHKSVAGRVRSIIRTIAELG